MTDRNKQKDAGLEPNARSDSSLIPMLVGGLLLTALGVIAVLWLS